MKTRYLACLAITALSVLWTGCAKKVASKTLTPPAPISTSAPSTTARSTPQQSAPQQPVERAASTQSRMPDAATRARIQDLLNRIQDAYFALDLDRELLAHAEQFSAAFQIEIARAADNSGQ